MLLSPDRENRLGRLFYCSRQELKGRCLGDAVIVHRAEYKSTSFDTQRAFGSDEVL